MAKKGTAKPRPRYRSTRTGRYVTKKYAKKHPKRTIKERAAASDRVSDLT